MSNNAAYYQEIQHTLECIHVQPLVITDPIGYETSQEEFTRTFKNIGIISNFSADIKFIGTGKDFIINIVENYGIGETITLRKEGRDPNTNEWVELYTSTLDLSTYKETANDLSVKINSGGFDKIFKSRESSKIEIERLTDLDGNTIPPLETKTIVNQGREIFLKSLLDVKVNDDTAIMHNADVGGVVGKTICVPLSIINKSDERVQSPIPNTTIGDNTDDRSESGVNGLMFYANNDRDKTLKLTFTISFDFEVSTQRLDVSRYWLRLATYKNGVEYNYKEAVNIWEIDNVQNYDNTTQTFSFSQDIDLKTSESLSLQFSQLMNGENDITEPVGRLNTTCSNIVCDLTIEEDSTYKSTITETLLLHDLGERLTNIIVGKQNRFKSNILGRIDKSYPVDGKWAYLTTYCGHWLRGFNLQDDLYKKYTTSFKDLKQTLKSILNVHVGFQNINGVEEVVAEEMEYFFNPNIVLELPNPLTKVIRTSAKDIIFSDIEGGYEKGAEVEGVMGLDEPNGKVNWVSNLTITKNNYSIVSKYIAGVYDEEKQRRYQKEDYPTEDRNRDKDIFLKDAKIVENQLTERLWADDFEALPTGIFSPETTKNLRLSPANNLKRHGRLLSTPLKHYQNESIAFGSSTANSNMMTKEVGKEQIIENQNIPNSSLGNRMFEPFYIEGEHIVDTSIINIIKDYSIFNGVSVPNINCKVKFTIENDPTIRYGYIMSLKPDGSGKWKFIEASSVT